MALKYSRRPRTACGRDLVPRQPLFRIGKAAQATGFAREITQARNQEPAAQPARYGANMIRRRSSQ